MQCGKVVEALIVVWKTTLIVNSFDTGWFFTFCLINKIELFSLFSFCGLFHLHFCVSKACVQALDGSKESLSTFSNRELKTRFCELTDRAS